MMRQTRTKQLYCSLLQWYDDATTTSHMKNWFDNEKNINTNWYDSKRTHWLQANHQWAGCCWEFYWFHKANTAFISKRTQTESANETIVIVTDKDWSAVNCPIKVEIVPLSRLLPRYLSIFTKHTLLSSAYEHEQRESAKKRELKSSLTRSVAQSIVQ